jgi:hypothetical protein
VEESEVSEVDSEVEESEVSEVDSEVEESEVSEVDSEVEEEEEEEITKYKNPANANSTTPIFNILYLSSFFAGPVPTTPGGLILDAEGVEELILSKTIL